MNILLTGVQGAGKSRLIDRLLKEYTGSYGGYKTIRAKTKLDDFFGVYLVDVKNTDTPLTKNNRVGTCNPDRSLICHADVLEKVGVDALSFSATPSLIVMDEIGVLEQACAAFTDKLMGCLDADVNVLGVIKKKQDSFLDAIIARHDVVLFEVSGQSSERIYEMVWRYLSV